MKKLAEQLINTMNIGIFTIDVNYIITSWNKWLFSASAIRPKYAIGKNLLEVFPDIVRRNLKEKFDYVFETGQIVMLSPQFHQYLLPFKITSSAFKDHFKYMQQKATLIPISDEKNKNRGIVVTIEDVTESVNNSNDLKKSWKELKEATDFLNSIFNGTSNHAIIVTKRDGRIISCNKGTSKLFGFETSEVIDHLKIQDLVIKSKGRERIDIDLYKDEFLNDETFFEEMIGLKKNGGEFPINFAVSSRKQNGELGSIIVINDITEQKKLQENLLHAQKLESIGTLAGGIAHDFNNILSGIIGNISLLKMKLNNDNKIYSILDTMEKISQRGAGLTKRILSFARKGKKLLNYDPIFLNEVVAEVEQIISKTIDKKVEIKISHDEDLWAIYGDWSQMEQIIMNLIVNAKDAISNNGSIEIKCENIIIDKNLNIDYPELDAGNYVFLSVKDTGSGIKREIMDRIFEPFFTTKEVGKGTGLGLSIVYGIIKDHDGYIFVESEENEGTAVKIFLPAKIENSKLKDMEQIEIIQKGSGKILIVEDEVFIRKMLEEILIELNYTVLIASNGVEAIEIFKRHVHDIDLVILDLIMPKLNGEETYKFLKKIKPDVKVLFTSGYSDKNIDLNYLDDQYINFIPKPYSMEEIVKKINSFL